MEKDLIFENIFFYEEENNFFCYEKTDNNIFDIKIEDLEMKKIKKKKVIKFQTEIKHLKNHKFFLIFKLNHSIKILNLKNKIFLELQIFDEKLFEISEDIKNCFYVDKPFQRLQIFNLIDNQKLEINLEFNNQFLESVNNLFLINKKKLGIYNKKLSKFFIIHFNYKKKIVFLHSIVNFKIRNFLSMKFLNDCNCYVQNKDKSLFFFSLKIFCEKKDNFVLKTHLNNDLVDILKSYDSPSKKKIDFGMNFSFICKNGIYLHNFESNKSINIYEFKVLKKNFKNFDFRPFVFDNDFQFFTFCCRENKKNKAFIIFLDNNKNQKLEFENIINIKIFDYNEDLQTMQILMLSETKKKLLYFFIQKSNKGVFEIKKEFSFEFDFGISQIFFDEKRNVIYLKEKNDKINTLFSSIFNIEENPFENLNIFFSGENNEEIIDLLFTKNYSILITPKKIKYYNKENEIINQFSNFTNNSFFTEFYLFGDLLFATKSDIISIFSPINYTNQILSINKKNAKIGLILLDRIFIFSDNTIEKEQEIYCHSIKGNISEILLLNTKISKKKKNFPEITSKILDFSENLIFSNKFVMNFLPNDFPHLLPYYFLKGNLSNLSLETKQKIGSIYKLDSLNPKIIFSKDINKKSLNLIEEVIQNDFYGVYKNMNRFDSLLYMLYSNNYKIFYDSLIDFLDSGELTRENMVFIVRENLNERLKYIFERDLQERDLRFNAQNFAILRKDEDILNELKRLVRDSKKKKLKFGETKYLIDLKIGKNKICLKPAKCETLEEFLGEKIIKNKNNYGEENNDNIEEEEKDMLSDMLVYLNFSEKSEENLLINIIDEEKIHIEGKDFEYIELDKDEPLEFEDIWGVKIEKLFSLKLENSTFIELEKNWGNDGNLIDVEFWFKPYNDKEIIFFSTNKAKLFFGFKNNKLIFQNGKNSIFFDEEKNNFIMGINKWNHISFILQNKSLKVFFNNKLIFEEILEKKIKSISKSKAYLFPFFNGEITEIRIWKTERSLEIREKFFKQPLPIIFSEANNVKIKLAKGKKKRKTDIITLQGLSSIFLKSKKIGKKKKKLQFSIFSFRKKISR